MLIQKYLHIILVLSFIAIVFAEEYFKATKMECAPSPKYFVNFTCRIKPVNRYKGVAMMETHIRNSLRNISINLSMYVRNDVNIYRPWLINTTQNICWYLGRGGGGPYFSMFMKTLTKFTNVNHSCPFTGPLIAKNLYLERKLIPLPFPKNAYKILLTFYEGYPLDFIGYVAYYMELLEGKTTNEALKL